MNRRGDDIENYEMLINFLLTLHSDGCLLPKILFLAFSIGVEFPLYRLS